MKNHGPRFFGFFLEAFHPEKSQKKPTLAVCGIMAIIHLYPHFKGAS